MNPEKQHLNTIKGLLILLTLFIIVGVGKFIWDQQTQIANYKQNEKHVLEQSANFELSRKNAIDSVVKPLNEKISSLQLENVKLQEQVKYQKVSIENLSRAYNSCQEEMNYVDIPDKDLIEPSINLVGKTLSQAVTYLTNTEYTLRLRTLEYSNVFPEGIIMRQNLEGAFVDIVISNGAIK